MFSQISLVLERVCLSALIEKENVSRFAENEMHGARVFETRLVQVDPAS